MDEEKRKEERFDMILRSRAYLPADSSLAERILARAARTPQRAPLKLGPWLERLFVDLQMPRPAYAFASVLAFGLLVGFGAVPVPAPANAQPYLEEEGEFL